MHACIQGLARALKEWSIVFFSAWLEAAVVVAHWLCRLFGGGRVVVLVTALLLLPEENEENLL